MERAAAPVSRFTVTTTTATAGTLPRVLMLPLLLLLLLVQQSPPGAHAYSSGTPDEACASMVPGHGPSRRLHNNPFPVITVTSGTYSPLQTIELVIEPRVDAFIRGFFIQARPANDTDSDTRLGTFIADEVAKTACSHGAITHRRAAERYSIRVAWRAPPGPVGDIKFRATVVNTFRDYYTDIYSAVITFQLPTTTTTTDTPTTTEDLWEEVTYTEVPPGYVFPDPPTTTTTPAARPENPPRGTGTPPSPHLRFPGLPANFTFPPGFPNAPANFTFPPEFSRVPANFTFPPGFPNVPANFSFPPGFPEGLMPDSYRRRLGLSQRTTGDGSTNTGFATSSSDSLLLLSMLLLLPLTMLK